MSQLATFTPLALETREQRLEREKAAAAAKPGFMDAIGDSINSEWMGAWQYRQWARMDSVYSTYDPNFRITEPLLKELGAGINPELWSKFSEASSIDDAKVIREQLLSLDQSRQRLASLGWKGTALQIGASILDPVAIAAFAGTDGLAGEAVYGAKLSRMARFVRGGLLGAGTGAATAAYAASEDPTKSYYDVLWAGLGGMILNGGINAAIPRAIAGKAQAAMRAVEADEVGYAMGAAARGELSGDVRRNIANILSEKGKAYFAGTLDEAGQRQIVDDVIGRAGFDPVHDADIITELRGMDPRDALDSFAKAQDGRAWADIVRELHPNSKVAKAEAARAAPDSPKVAAVTKDAIKARAEELAIDFPNMDPQARLDAAKLQLEAEVASGVKPPAGAKPPEPPPKVGGDLFLPDVQEVPKAAMNKVRFGLAGRLGASESPLVRKLAYFMGGDALSRAGELPAIGGVIRWVGRKRDATMTRFWREFVPIGTEYGNTIGKAFKGETRARFAEEVTKAVRVPRGTYTDPHLNKAADLARKLIKDIFDTTQRHNVKGSLKFEASDTYAPIIHNPILWQRAVAAHGEDAVRDMVAGGLKSAAVASGESLSDEAATAGARAYLKGVLALDDYSDTFKGALFTGIVDPAEMADFLRYHAPSITDDHLGELTRAFGKQADKANPTANTVGRLKPRTPLDIQYRHTMPDGSSLGIQDLIENNIEVLLQSYARDMLGASGMAELFRAMSPDPAAPIQSYRSLREAVIRDMNKSGLASGPDGKQLVDATLARLDTLHRGIMGLPQEANTTFGEVLRTARGFAYLKDSGGFGVAQLADLGNTVAEGGVEAIFQQIPALKAVFARAKTGQLSNELLDDIETTLAAGTQRIRNQIVDRIDYTGEVATVADSGLDSFVRKTNRFASDVSGLHAADAFTQRTTAAVLAQRIVNQAFAGKPMSKARILSLGLTEDDAARLFAAIRHEASKTDGGVFVQTTGSGRTLRGYDLGKWDDVYAASKFVDTVDQWSRRAVQQVDLGNIPMWMSKELGRTLMQFRVFSAAAWEKNFLSRIQIHDGPAITGMAWTSIIGGLAYVTQQYAASIGRADAQEFRDKRLSTSSIVRAAVQRGSWSTFGPDAFDTVYRPLVGEPFFSYRNTGLDTGFLSPSSNPTVQGLQDAYGSIGNAAGWLFRGEPMTPKKADQFMRLLPFHNVVGVKNLLDAIGTRTGETP